MVLPPLSQSILFIRNISVYFTPQLKSRNESRNPFLSASNNYSKIPATPTNHESPPPPKKLFPNIYKKIIIKRRNFQIYVKKRASIDKNQKMGVAMLKKISFTLIIGLLILSLLGTGCGREKTAGLTAPAPDTKQKATSVKDKQEPKTDPINAEQKKNPLPNGSKPYTGVIIQVEGMTVTMDVEGVRYQVVLTNSTNIQKGNNPGTGKLADLKPQTKINVLVQDGKALSVHFE